MHKADFRQKLVVSLNEIRDVAWSCSDSLPIDAMFLWFDDRAPQTAFSEMATKHRGVEELRTKRGRPPKAETDRKEQIALRLDADVLACYRSLGAGWQTRMNAVLKAYRDATF